MKQTQDVLIKQFGFQHIHKHAHTNAPTNARTNACMHAQNVLRVCDGAGWHDSHPDGAGRQGRLHSLP